MGIQKPVRYAKEITEPEVHKGTKPAFKVPQDGPGVMDISPTGPFAALAIWRVGSLNPHGAKMLYKQKEKRNTWRWVYQQRESEDHGVEEGEQALHASSDDCRGRELLAPVHTAK